MILKPGAAPDLSWSPLYSASIIIFVVSFNVASPENNILYMFIIGIPFFQSFNPIFPPESEFEAPPDFYVLPDVKVFTCDKLNWWSLLLDIMNINAAFELFLKRSNRNRCEKKSILSSVSVFVATWYFIPDEKERILKGITLSLYLLAYWKAKMFCRIDWIRIEYRLNQFCYLRLYLGRVALELFSVVCLYGSMVGMDMH